LSADAHLFICFSSKDEHVAVQVVECLEREGLKCWIQLRDVLPGHNYQETIVQALESAKGLIFLFSEHSAASGEIKKELSIAATLNLPVFPLRLAPIRPTGALRYELATRQWIDIFHNPEQALRTVAETIRQVLHSSATEVEQRPPLGSTGMATLGVSRTLPQAPTSARERTRQHVPVVGPGSEEFEVMRSLLARYIGPIAKIYVQKAAVDALTPDDFCEQLAAHINVPANRTAFLKAARAQLGAKSQCGPNAPGRSDA
jgi:TIR domain